MLVMTYVVYVDLHLMDVLQMRNFQEMIVPWCGVCVHMPSTCSVSTSGCHLRQNQNVHFVGNIGNSNLHLNDRNLKLVLLVRLWCVE